MSGDAAFDRLHPQIQRWVHAQRWQSLHDAQQQAIGPILAGERDVVVCAPTAAGKTEAAFLPILSVLAAARDTTAATAGRVPGGTADLSTGDGAATGVEVLCVSPLKALINDQFDRLEQLCETVDVPVWRWHGDVAAGVKRKLLEHPCGVLVITPESLEALFVNRGPRIGALFAGLRYVVIDEMHAFVATPRGAQVQSLLDRVERSIRRRVPRVALSATLADPAAAGTFLRPADPTSGATVESSSETDLRLQLRSYITDTETRSQDDAENAVAAHLFAHLRNGDHLVFANSRLAVETYADRLAGLSETAGIANRFFPHHGNLSRDMRENVEERLKNPSTPTVAVCTSTLELGVDIGTAQSVAQVGCPPSVAALRQRLGRSGRRDDPSVLRIYTIERRAGEQSGILDRLRWTTVQTAAMVELMLSRWLEPSDDPGYNYSTLIQQTLSVIAQTGGASPAQLHKALCGPGPFASVDAARYARLLRAAATHDLVVQTGDGLLLAGETGEQRINHYTFYAAFAVPDEWKVSTGGRTLGTVPISEAIHVGALIVFAGRRWRIALIDEPAQTIEVTRSASGRPPPFAGSEGAWIHDQVRDRMRDVYTSDEIPAWMDQNAASLITEGREEYRQLSLTDTTVAVDGDDIVLCLFAGDRTLHTAAVALGQAGLEACVEGPAVRIVDTDTDTLADTLETMVSDGPPAGADLAAAMANRCIDKWDWALDDTLSCEAAARRRLDPPAAWAALTAAAADLRR